MNVNPNRVYRRRSSSIATSLVWGGAYLVGGRKGLMIAIISGTVMSIATLNNLGYFDQE